jgi:hypothetical protein
MSHLELPAHAGAATSPIILLHPDEMIDRDGEALVQLSTSGQPP